MGKRSRGKKLQRQGIGLPDRQSARVMFADTAESRVLAIVVFAGLCFLLFYPPYFRAMFFTQEQLPTHLLTYILFALWWLVKYYRRDGTFLREPLDYLVFAFVLAYVVSFTVAINTRGAIQEFLKVGNYFLVYWLVMQLGQTQKGAPVVLLNILMFSALGVAVLGLGAAAGTWEVIGGYVDGRIYSTIQYPNSLAAFLTGAFLVSLALWQTAAGKFRRLYALASFLLLITAVLTYSRGGWLIMPVFFMLYIIFCPRGRRLDAALFTGVVSAVAIGLTAAPGRAQAAGGSLWLWILGGCLAVLVGEYLLIDLRRRVRPAYLLAAAALLALLLVGAVGGYVVHTLRAPLHLAQSGVEQLISVKPGVQHNLKMDVSAVNEGEAPFAWQLTVLEQRRDNSIATLAQEAGPQTRGWESSSFSFTTSGEAKRVLVRVESLHAGTSAEVRQVTLTGDGRTHRLGFAWNRVLPDLLYSRLFGLDRERNVLERLVFFEDAWKIVKDHPWRGLGGHAWSSIYFQYQSAPYSTTEVHNHFLQVWIETGVVGFLIFVGIWLAFIFTSFKLYKKAAAEQRTVIAGIATGVLAVVAHSVYDFNLSLGAVSLFIFALMGVTRSFVPLPDMAAGRSAGYKPLAAITVAAVLTVFVVRLMTAGWASDEGISLMRQGRLDQGIQAFEQAVRYDPFDPQMRMMLAEAYENKALQTENPVFLEKAREQYTAALNNNRYNPRYVHALGSFLVRSGHFDDGLAYLRETTTLHPLFVGHHRVYAHAAVSVAHFFMQNNDQAAGKRYLERVLAAEQTFRKLFEDQASLAFAAGQAHFMLGELEQALIYLEKAVNVEEDKANALMILSLIHERKGDSTRAKELYEQALAINQESEATYQAFKNL
ncbi:MAG: Photosystem I assembly protein Ycf3 [Syntrophomonadaceae bacterium]|nr:Photosystem I assembly protein Ycf3 [Bacillota bacterium]